MLPNKRGSTITIDCVLIREIERWFKRFNFMCKNDIIKGTESSYLFKNREPSGRLDSIILTGSRVFCF